MFFLRVSPFFLRLVYTPSHSLSLSFPFPASDRRIASGPLCEQLVHVGVAEIVLLLGLPFPLHPPARRRRRTLRMTHLLACTKKDTKFTRI